MEGNDNVKSLIRKYSDYSPDSISQIISNYQGYRPEALEAALYLAVDKGMIAYDLKETLWNQIRVNMEAAERPIKNYNWEHDNAFLKFISDYSDEQLYEIIESPKEKAIDFFHAVLMLALKRELISSHDFAGYYEEAKLSVTGEMSGSGINSFVSFSEPEQSEIDVQHPQRDEVISRQKEIVEENKTLKYTSPVRFGIGLLIAGPVIVALEYIRPLLSSFDRRPNVVGYLVGGLAALLGIGFIVYGFFDDGRE